jgi:hypothetical protein
MSPSERSDQHHQQTRASNRDKSDESISLGVLIRTDGKGLTLAGWSLFVVVPILFYTGRYTAAAAVSVAAIVAAFVSDQQSIKQAKNNTGATVTSRARPFQSAKAHDILREMAYAGEKLIQQRITSDNNDILLKASSQIDDSRRLILLGLKAMANKYGKRQKQLSLKQHNHGHRTTKTRSPTQDDDDDDNMFALLCQDAAYIGFRTFDNDDEVVEASFAILALVAKVDVVRERHLYQADLYGLDGPITCAQHALLRAQEYTRSRSLQKKNENQIPFDLVDDYSSTVVQSTNGNHHTITNSLGSWAKSVEAHQAELQRKGCLFLGALTDGNADIARLVSNEGGIDHVLATLDWFRFHSEVANWGLWALFTFLYENRINQVKLVEAGGVRIIIQTLNNILDSQEVARHGLGTYTRGSLAVTSSKLAFWSTAMI